MQDLILSAINTVFIQSKKIENLLVAEERCIIAIDCLKNEEVAKRIRICFVHVKFENYAEEERIM